MKSISIILLAAFASLSISVAKAATPLYEEVFANLGAGDPGYFSNGRLVQAPDGNFYGTCQQGGTKLGGTDFRVTLAGQLTTIYPFDIQPGDIGSFPHAAFCLGTDGNLYGTTTRNSGNDAGSFFKISVAGQPTFLYPNPPLLSIYAFTQLLAARDGTFYAALYDLERQPEFPITGFVLHLAADGTPLFSTQMDRTANGAEPKAALTEGAGGNVYGTASEGGANNLGTIFRVTPGGVIILLHSFAGPDGSKPESSLVKASDGNFYGTTTRGGASDMGTVFRIKPNGTVTTLVSFNGANGSFPASGLTIGPDGQLYGTTNTGGTNHDGTFYRMTLQGVLTTLASFNASTGAVPSGGVTLGSDGKFYATTDFGGDNGFGTVYRATSNGTLTKLASLFDTEGWAPLEGVIQGSDGNFYGSAALGGINNSGTIFKIDQSGKVSTVAALDETTGFDPAPVVQGTDGNLYGATHNGAANNGGAVFKTTLAGDLTVLAALDGTTGYTASDLLLGSDGNLYGLTEAGGPALGGTIFRLTNNGKLKQVAALTIGASPSGYFRFTRDSNGSFYGTASDTGDQPNGLAFTVSASGAQSTLATFDSFDDGQEPASGLTKGLDGNFYGTTLAGGASNTGSVFRLTPAGVLSALHVFDSTEANGSAGRLLRMSDGSFFGTTFQNDNNGAPGLLFRITTSGVFEKWPVFDGLHGSSAQGSLTFGSDGYIYGTTAEGGTVDGGVVYRFTSSPPQLSTFSPTKGRPGDSVVLVGRYLAGTSSVRFNGADALGFTIDSSGQITAVVPQSATTGPITITNPLGTASTSAFTVMSQ